MVVVSGVLLFGAIAAPLSRRLSGAAHTTTEADLFLGFASADSLPTAFRENPPTTLPLPTTDPTTTNPPMTISPTTDSATTTSPPTTSGPDTTAGTTPTTTASTIAGSTTTTARPPPASNELWAMGDIADCGGNHNDDDVGHMLAATVGVVATLGDTAYPTSSTQDFTQCFDPAWGPIKARIRPTLGNNEYHQPGAQGYFDYFGAAAGERGKGWYSYDVGTWHVIVLNTLCAEVGGCGAASPQGQWLAADLAAHPTTCTAAMWHYPRFSSGYHGSITASQDFWQLLYDGGADIVLSGHDHSYERFAPQNPKGGADPARGIRQFVAGTGGKSAYAFKQPLPNSQVRYSGAFGSLHLTLNDGSYSWQFVQTGGVGTLNDSGTDSCH